MFWKFKRYQTEWYQIEIIDISRCIYCESSRSLGTMADYGVSMVTLKLEIGVNYQNISLAEDPFLIRMDNAHIS